MHVLHARKYRHIYRSDTVARGPVAKTRLDDVTEAAVPTDAAVP